jgi:hypothetical protein
MGSRRHWNPGRGRSAHGHKQSVERRGGERIPGRPGWGCRGHRDICELHEGTSIQLLYSGVVVCCTFESDNTKILLSRLCLFV